MASSFIFRIDKIQVIAHNSYSHYRSDFVARRPATNPRKSASQARSRQTVDALLEATARVLIKEGYDKTSTNKIAAVAGVSIGSLYQYFPTKEALVAAVIDLHMHEMFRLVREALVKVTTHPIEAAARELVSVMIEAHRINPKLHRILVEQTPRTGKLENVEAVEREAYGLVRAYLEAHRDELDVADTGLAAFVCVTAVEALTHAAVVRPSERLTDEQAARLVNDVTRLVVRYLQKSPKTESAPAQERRTNNRLKRDRRQEKRGPQRQRSLRSGRGSGPAQS
jgi:AcrR family transcriptional regulator